MIQYTLNINATQWELSKNLNGIGNPVPQAKISDSDGVTTESSARNGGYCHFNLDASKKISTDGYILHV